MNINTMLSGMVIINGRNGLKDRLCSSDKLKKKVNKEGAYSVFEISICAGVTNITKNSMKISLQYFLLIDATIKHIKSVLIRYIVQYIKLFK